MRNNTQRLARAVRSLYDYYAEKNGCLAPEYKQAACNCTNALQMWRGPKGDAGPQGPKGDKGDNAGSFLVDASFEKNPEGMPEGSYLKLVLIDVAQQEQVVYVDLSELTDIYEGGGGISIVDMVVAAKLGAGLRFDALGNVESAYQFCNGLDIDENVISVRIDGSDKILGFASGDCGGLTATVNLTASAEGTALVLTGRDGDVLSTVPLTSSDGLKIEKTSDGGFTWLVDVPALVSNASGNQLGVKDGKLYAGPNELSYEYGEGRLTLKDSSGGTLSELSVPTMVKSLESAELVCHDAPAESVKLLFASSMTEGEQEAVVPLEGSVSVQAAPTTDGMFTLTVDSVSYTGQFPFVVLLPLGITCYAQQDGSISFYGPQASAPRKVVLLPAGAEDVAVFVPFCYPDDRLTVASYDEAPGASDPGASPYSFTVLTEEPVCHGHSAACLSYVGGKVHADIAEADMSGWPMLFDRADLALTFLKDDGSRVLQNVPLDCMTDFYNAALENIAHPVAVRSVEASFSCGKDCSGLDDFSAVTIETAGGVQAYASWDDDATAYWQAGSVPEIIADRTYRKVGTNMVEIDMFRGSGHFNVAPDDYPYLGYFASLFAGIPAAQSILTYALPDGSEGPVSSASGYDNPLHKTWLVCRHDKADAGATVEYETIFPLMLASKPDGTPWAGYEFGVKTTASITYDAVDEDGKIPGFTVNSVKTTFYGLRAWCEAHLLDSPALTLSTTKTDGTTTEQSISFQCMKDMMGDAAQELVEDATADALVSAELSFECVGPEIETSNPDNWSSSATGIPVIGATFFVGGAALGQTIVAKQSPCIQQSDPTFPNSMEARHLSGTASLTSAYLYSPATNTTVCWVVDFSAVATGLYGQQIFAYEGSVSADNQKSQGLIKSAVVIIQEEGLPYVPGDRTIPFEYAESHGWAIKGFADFKYDSSNATYDVTLDMTMYTPAAWKLYQEGTYPKLAFSTGTKGGASATQDVDMSCINGIIDTHISAATPVATSSNNGLMASGDKAKLDGLSHYPRITKAAVANLNTSDAVALSESKPSTLWIRPSNGINGNISILNEDAQSTLTITLSVNPSAFAGSGLEVSTIAGRKWLTVPVYVGARDDWDGEEGLVPSALTSEKDKFLKGDGTWGTIPIDSMLSDTSTNPVQNRAVTAALNDKVSADSPAFTGTPTAPTAAENDNSMQIATTAFVKTALSRLESALTELSRKVVYRVEA